MIPGWRLYAWRFFTNRRENVPKLVLSLMLLGMIKRTIDLSSLHHESLPGFTDDLRANFSVALSDILDEEKIIELARRKAETMAKRAEAEEYFQKYGNTRVPTHQYFVAKDNLGY